jgi:hypothetical protein
MTGLLRGLRNARFPRTRRERIFSLKQRRCNETNQYHPTQQSPHENDWLPRNENLHGRTSGDEARLTISVIILRNPYTFSVNIVPHVIVGDVETFSGLLRLTVNGR